MKKKQFLAIMLLAQVSLVVSAATVYTDEATFLTQMDPYYYLEDFSNYIYNDPIHTGQPTADFGAVDGYSWTASTIPDGTFTDTYGLVSLTNALSTDSPKDLLTITFTGSEVTALGGIFASTDTFLAVADQQKVIITLSDKTSASFLGSDFRGFTSDVAIASLTINAVNDPNDPNNVFWPMLAHFYVGSAISAVPVPGAIWLFGSGLLGLFSLTRRSKFG
jgi:hypothetical protein